MKEFIEKLIERLEYLQKDKYVLAPTVCYVLGGVKQYVNQLAEEYKGGYELISRRDVIKVLEECHLDKSLFEKDVFEKINSIPTYNNSWILVSEKLPEEQKCKDGHIDPSEEVLVYIYYSKNCVNNGCGVSRYWNSSKQHENPWIDLKYGKDNVIAWQPLPAPYRPKENKVEAGRE